MDTIGQFREFCICVAFGVGCGVLYEAFSLLKTAFFWSKAVQKILIGVFDICFWLVLFVGSVWLTYTFSFSEFRVYTWVGYLLGGILYLKTLHKIVAFLKKMCYNKLRIGKKRATDREKTLKKEKGKQL